MIPAIDFHKYVVGAATIVADRFHVELIVDERTVSEIDAYCRRSLESFNQDDPSAAKIAGNMVFWIRKLKPVFHAKGYFPSANEYIALLCGLALINAHWQEKRMKVVVSKRALMDFSRSLRFHSHSPHGLALTFELFMSASAAHT